MANVSRPHEGNNTSAGSTYSPWSRQYKIALVASSVLLGFLLIVSACSRQASKAPLVAVSSPTQPAASAPASAAPATPVATTPVTKKKVQKKRSANINYSEPNYGVSFSYPRKYEFLDNDKAKTELAGLGAVPMNFTQSGGIAVASVTMPENAYPGTDFAGAFFTVNVNRGVSEQECSQFAFVDHNNPDGEPMDPDQAEVGSLKFSRTSDFEGSMMKQAETEYFHRYENGACYEFVLGLGTEGYGAKEGIEPVDRDQVFAKLEKILATVKIKTVEQPQVAEKTASQPETATAEQLQK